MNAEELGRDFRCDNCGDDVGSDSLRQCECGMRLCFDCRDLHGIPCVHAA